MAASAERPPLVLALLLLLAGVAALATAVLLVWSRFDLREPSGPAPLAREPVPAAEVAGVARPGPGPADAGTAQPAEPAGEPGTADAGPTAPARGPWHLTLDTKGRELDADSEGALAEAAALLVADPAARARLTGIRGKGQSSKRALQAARAVRERLMAAGVERRRFRVESENGSDLEGMAVRIDIEGGPR